MLLRLEIQNIALIEEAKIELEDGLNILTGETGAGKSIIIDSINILLGERFSKELIRTGQDKALIEAVFQIRTSNDSLTGLFNKYGIEPDNDGTIIVSREYNVSGRSVCRINGRLVTVSAIKELGGYLIDVHGQHDNQSLLRSETHIELLDAFGGKRIYDLKKKYLELFEKRRALLDSLQQLLGDEKDRERKIDLLKYQIDEIKKANLSLNEEDELNNKKTLLINAAKINEVLSSAYEILFTGTGVKVSSFDKINEAVVKLKEIERYSENYSKLVIAIEDILYQLEDLREELRKEKDTIEYNPYLLEQIEERLDLIFRLKRKYGSSIDEILEYCKNSEDELDRIIRSEELIKKIQCELQEVNCNLYNAAMELSSARKEIALILEESIEKELHTLEMKKVKFKVDIYNQDAKVMGDAEDNKNVQTVLSSINNINFDEVKFKSSGLDKVEFLISTNPGEPLKPLIKIASGGEMARMMLTIKSILADVDKVPTLIFDEIDIGISGKVSQRVGEKLALLSRKHQVICVTHNPHIASMADNHIMVEKFSGGNVTKIKVNRLTSDKIQTEIARILGGDSISEKTLSLANEMLENAEKFKMELVN